MSQIPNLKLVQDHKIAQQVIDKALQSNKQVAINVINIGQVNNLCDEEYGNEKSHVKENSMVLKDYLDSLPQPRLQSLITRAMKLAADTNRTQLDAAHYLGVSQATISKQTKKIEGGGKR
jgi:hypothetical protein